MQRLTLENLQPSLVLARPATDDKGRTLIAKGVELNQSHIDQLRRRGVEAIWVEGEPVQESAFDADGYRQLRTAFLEEAFSLGDQTPAMADLKAAFLDQMEMRIREETTAPAPISDEDEGKVDGESPSATDDEASH